METLELTYEEYWGYYWRVLSRYRIPGIFKWDEDLIGLIEEQCRLPRGASVLDLGCGGADQARLLARKGYRVVGVDKVEALIEHARDAFAREGLDGEFIHGDMRQVEYSNEFDLCVMLSGTFGLLGEQDNERLLQSINRALRPGGHAFLSYSSLERYATIPHTRSWHEIEGGFALREEWFDASTSTYHTKNMHILLEGKLIRAAEQPGYGADEVIRCYGVREIELLAERSGFQVKAHLSTKSIADHDHVPDSNEPRGILILGKDLF